jgi:hypothetical protein
MNPPSLFAEVLQALAAQLGAFESLLLLASALHKALTFRRLATVVGRFAGLRQSLVPVALAGSAALEVAAGGLLWVPGLHALGAVLAVVVWAGYLALIVRAIAAGRRDADCGCSFGAAPKLLGAYQVTRNTVLLGLAVFVAVDAWWMRGLGQGAAGGLAGILGSELLAAGALLALYGALDQVMALQPLRGGETA